MAKLSIVSVCYQDRDALKQTMDSVLEQTNREFEYIIQDGGSTDGTLDLVEEYRDHFQRLGIPFSFLSERDSGIYDAMNRATQRCRGEWVLYLNAGDCFVDAEVLSNVWDAADGMEADQDAVILYGNTIELEKDGPYLWRSNIEDLDVRCALCHQSVFICTEWMKAYPYDLCYRIGADYDFFLKTRAEGGIFAPLNVTISKITKDGFSNQNEKERVLETERIKEKYGLADRSSWKYRWLYVQASIKQWMIDYLPEDTVAKAKQLRRKMRKRGEKL